jgi:hypothetical protein
MAIFKEYLLAGRATANQRIANRKRANGWASAARHRPDRQPSKMMLNFGSWADRLHAGLGGYELKPRLIA